MTAPYHNARAVDASGVPDDTWLLVERDRIVRVGTGDGWREHLVEASTVLDLADRLLVPGLIDLHCHGAVGTHSKTAERRFERLSPRIGSMAPSDQAFLWSCRRSTTRSLS